MLCGAFTILVAETGITPSVGWSPTFLYSPCSLKMWTMVRFQGVSVRKAKAPMLCGVFTILVAETGIEPVSRGYEPRELPLLYSAIYRIIVPYLQYFCNSFRDVY